MLLLSTKTPIVRWISEHVTSLYFVCETCILHYLQPNHPIFLHERSLKDTELAPNIFISNFYTSIFLKFSLVTSTFLHECAVASAPFLFHMVNISFKFVLSNIRRFCLLDSLLFTTTGKKESLFDDNTGILLETCVI